jgi:uncharacterized protein (TIGR02118 family)
MTLAAPGGRAGRQGGPAAIKKIAFLVAKPGLSDGAFRLHWRTIHGPLVAGSPGYGAWRTRYVQNHVLGPGPIGGSFNFSGMAEFWLPGDAPNEDDFSATSIYRDRIRVDEMNFVDLEQTVSMAAEEDVMKAGIGRAKLVALSSRASGLPQDDFRRMFASEYRAAVLSDPRLSDRLRGWRVTTSSRVRSAFRERERRPDCNEQFWFDSDIDMRDEFAAEAYHRRIRPIAARLFSSANRRSFQAEELVFFDAGRPSPDRRTLQILCQRIRTCFGRL